MLNNNLTMGIDIGSTTVKTVVLRDGSEYIYNDYRRHHGSINDTLAESLKNFQLQSNDIELSLAVTGSGGLGLGERLDLPFVQELVASADYIEKFYPDVRTLIDIGGEDSKVIFFHDKNTHDLRMNGSCAGGTGSFIDQMATLLNISNEELDRLAEQHEHIYPIASRCGVFAKTDVQNLLSRQIPRHDIAASVFHSIAVQIKNTLMRGFEAAPRIAFSGGPLSFLNSLKQEILRVFNVQSSSIVPIRYPEFVAAAGAALTRTVKRKIITLEKLIERLSKSNGSIEISSQHIKPLFNDDIERQLWENERRTSTVERIDLNSLDCKECFLGIDSGSTTTKIALIDSDSRLAFRFYKNNDSDPIGAVRIGLAELREALGNIKPVIARTAVTGYGEDLIRAAFNLDEGIVETYAHYRAARRFDEKVSFILDIGGQDMKAVFLKDGIIRSIEINEACSSGCGSFIETFAQSSQHSVEDFASIACTACKPCDLGTRCTVFMNSKVKQCFREGDSVDNISAGLAYSVINNCLHKVLKLHDKSALGDNIIVQGGTFKNPAVHKAFENIVGKRAICPDISELMGAYGAALTASDTYAKLKTGEIEGNIISKSSDLLTNFNEASRYSVKLTVCKGCENNCTVSRLKFDSGSVFFTGNRCENVFSTGKAKIAKGKNLVSYRYDLLFNRKLRPDGDVKLKIGIPRALNLYENFPFWHALFFECGFETVLSEKSNHEISDKGAGSVMSDNICYPAKLAHGHIADLIEKGVERIFYPIVTYEFDDLPGASNSYNCPVVTGYPDVLRNAMAIEAKTGIPFDTPNITFKDEKLLRRGCIEYLTKLGINRKLASKAVSKAIIAQNEFKQNLKAKAEEIIADTNSNGKILIVLAMRPYHTDSLINHGIPEMICDYGFNVVTDDSLPLSEFDGSDLQVLSQWTYPNRLYFAAKWIAMRPNAEFVQLNSFGCGPDSIAVDEVKDLLDAAGKNHTVIRIDDLTSAGALRLRIRSLAESIKRRKIDYTSVHSLRKVSKPFTKEDAKRTILAPFFSPFHSIYTSAPFRAMGYNFELLPPSDSETIKLGLQYVNNEICYPATLVIGDVLKALKSGKYNPNEVAVGITQTGGQCRASNYLSLLKKALIKAGFEDVPVVGVSLSSKLLNKQPGFKLNRKTLIVNGILGILFGDALADMYYSTAPREIEKGSAMRLVEKYAARADKPIETGNRKAILSLLKEALMEFNSIPVSNDTPPKIGVVGEIYVKYNTAGNLGIVDELI